MTKKLCEDTLPDVTLGNTCTIYSQMLMYDGKHTGLVKWFTCQLDYKTFKKLLF